MEATFHSYTIEEEYNTPQLNEKFLSKKSSWDFEGGLDTIKPN